MSGVAQVAENIEMDEEIEVKTQLNPKGDTASPSVVKFTSGTDVENGEANVDVVNKGKTSVGMSKTELMQYANDPFWIRLRMSLFGLFWVVWFALLVIAIGIIAMAKKC